MSTYITWRLFCILDALVMGAGRCWACRETTGILQVPSKGPGLPYLLSPGVPYLGRSLAQFIYDGHKLLLHINTVERTEGGSLPRALTVIPRALAAAPTQAQH